VHEKEQETRNKCPKKSQIPRIQFPNKLQVPKLQFPKEFENVGFIAVSYEGGFYAESHRGPQITAEKSIFKSKNSL
jgi:hypothetical protein